ncbi:MAG: flagellar hook-basal body protein [Chloroflexi bacterium]|nr:flagellar hook-basal body protein [Chloroflexota bacterium]
MIKGLYAAASAMLAGLDRQNTLSHNLANVDTPGFKQLLTPLDDFDKTTVLSLPKNRADLAGLRLLGTLGLGVDAAPETTDFTQGALKSTGQPLDLAIEGDGFFRVQTPAGERYTRDGRFTRDAAGGLVTVDGYAVLSSAGAPITLPPAALGGTVSVAADGTLAVDANEVAQLGLASFDDPAAQLTRDPLAGNAFAGTPGNGEVGRVQQGYLETANVNPAQLMTQMLAVGRAYEAAQQLVQIQDELLGRAIATISRL